jgi:hypothetical protein
MKSSRCIENNHSGRRPGFSRWSLGMALALGVYGLGGFVAAQAQTTVGRVFGVGPSGGMVVAHGTTGAHRHATINAKGRYVIGTLPLGVYTVTLEKDGKSVDTRSNINLTVGGGAEIDFACPHDQCAESAAN